MSNEFTLNKSSKIPFLNPYDREKRAQLSYGTIYDEDQSQSAKFLTMPWEQAHQDDSSDTNSNGMLTWNSFKGCGVSWESLKEPVIMVVPTSFADWVWHSTKIGEFQTLFQLKDVIDWLEQDLNAEVKHKMDRIGLGDFIQKTTRFFMVLPTTYWHW